eukprot:CAMPEP_0182905804 /NCGR_PEP_ID=MMETSP0034_2-20130328/33233_1 /TAXON_ID=156128 /ORGANISM="Nephroselmis pyriformis, Strain CCMP717" /LENGTH=60 /DNA_ID=CAMNT_0025041303 /DNA_START=38 /DNA_END=217 /DNA_ORIENTATION=+
MSPLRSRGEKEAHVDAVLPREKEAHVDAGSRPRSSCPVQLEEVTRCLTIKVGGDTMFAIL